VCTVYFYPFVHETCCQHCSRGQNKYHRDLTLELLNFIMILYSKKPIFMLKIFSTILWLFYATEKFFKLLTHIVVEKFKKTITLCLTILNVKRI